MISPNYSRPNQTSHGLVNRVISRGAPLKGCSPPYRSLILFKTGRGAVPVPLNQKIQSDQEIGAPFLSMVRQALRKCEKWRK